MSNNCIYLIFSKNRALQLHALLESVVQHVVGEYTPVILYTHDAEHASAYEDVINLFPQFTFVKETNFSKDVISILKNSKAKFAFFSPDNGVFIRHTDIDDVCVTYEGEDVIPSLRLGTHLKVCHPVGNKEQQLPEFTREGNKYFWKWVDGELDWAYPMALDTSIFLREFILICIESLPEFKSPTSLEILLQSYLPYLEPARGACYEESKFVSLPWNAVTTEISNLNGGISEELFLEEWEKGNKLNCRNIYGSLPISCHQEYEVEFVKR